MAAWHTQQFKDNKIIEGLLSMQSGEIQSQVNLLEKALSAISQQKAQDIAADNYTLPDDFIINYFYTYVGKPSKKRDSYNGSCPMCREGKSWLKKKRFYFIPKTSTVYCHNCGYSKSALNWIAEVTNRHPQDILEEAKSNIYDASIILNKHRHSKDEHDQLLVLPDDSINLDDPNQVNYYKDLLPVSRARVFLEKRLLNKAINKPKNFYISLTDAVHKNRLVIPFFDFQGKIVHYQTRKLLDDSSPKYLSKQGEKSVFGLDNIDYTLDNVYVFEGPLDACFVKNGIAVAGIQENTNKLFTKSQEETMSKLGMHRRIWVLDNQFLDSASFRKTEILINLNEKVFIWPRGFKDKGLKDFNEIAVYLKTTAIPENFILENVYDSVSAKIKLFT